MSKSLVKLLIGILVIGGGLGYLVYNAMQSSWAYYISVDDFATKQNLAQTHTLRIAGIVEKGSISRILEKMELSFNLSGKDTSLPIRFNGTVPENFAEDREVVVEGRLNTGEHKISFDANNNPSGIYIVFINANDNIITYKTVLIK